MGMPAMEEPPRHHSSVEEIIHQLNPELPLFNVNPLSVTMQLGALFGRVAATFAASFGLLAMLLAAVGIYGVVAYTSRQRAREIGIRMALGAEKGGIYSLVLGQGFRLTLAGLVVGTALAVAFTRLLKAQLFGVSETDAIYVCLGRAASGRCRSGRVPHPRPPRHAS
jgi:predicted lysophospholipase L1 biosynthesis ABC-type transport system permease subunit